jgi:hypothetical protein
MTLTEQDLTRIEQKLDQILNLLQQHPVQEDRQEQLQEAARLAARGDRAGAQRLINEGGKA